MFLRVAGHTENTLLLLVLHTTSLPAATPWLAAGEGRGFSCLNLLQSMDGVSVAPPSVIVPLPTEMTSVG